MEVEVTGMMVRWTDSVCMLSSAVHVPNKPMVSVGVKQHSTNHDTEFRSCVKVEVDVLGSRP